MNEFFKFIFNPDILNKVLRPSWIQLFDFNYIDTNVIGGLLLNSEIYGDLLLYVQNKAQVGYISTSERKSVSTATTRKKGIIPVPFNLTQPKPRIIQEPVKMYNKFVTKPVPVENYKKVGSLEQIDNKRKERLDSIKAGVIKKYEQVRQFEFETEKRYTRSRQNIGWYKRQRWS